MKNLTALLLSVGCTINAGRDAAPVTAKTGGGIVVDPSQQLAIDPAIVATKADVDAAASTANAALDSYKTTAAATYLGVTGQAADSARLGNKPASEYVQFDSSGANIDLGNGRVVMTANGSRSSVFGLYCGMTTTATVGAFSGPGSTVGYVAGKKLCEQATGCGALAHQCSVLEMVRSSELASFAVPSAVTRGWVSAGGNWAATSVAYPINDCNGWHIGSPYQAAGGLVFYLNDGAGGQVAGYTRCDSAEVILCCQ